MQTAVIITVITKITMATTVAITQLLEVRQLLPACNPSLEISGLSLMPSSSLTTKNVRLTLPVLRSSTLLQPHQGLVTGNSTPARISWGAAIFVVQITMKLS